MNKNEKSDIYRVTILVASAFTFAYCFGVSIHEIGHIVAYQYYGISTEILVLDPFGHSYMEPVRDYAAGELLQRSGGSLFNVICACLVSTFFWKKQNLYAFPILMWSGAAFIQESVAILLDVANGVPRDWGFVVAEGIPVYLVLSLSAIFMLIGCGIFLRLLAVAGIKPHHSNTKIMTVCLLGITPFFIISLIYVNLFLGSDQNHLVESKSISLGASIVLSLIFSIMFKPFYPKLEKVWSVNSQVISQKHLISSFSIAVLYVAFCAFFYN